MYKGTVEICKVNKYMRLKYNLILKDDDLAKIRTNQYTKQDLIKVFIIGGNQYLKISPIEYITVDISRTSDKNDAWNSNLQINLNRYGVFEWKEKISKMIEEFQTTELYFKRESKLYVNTQLANQYMKSVNTPSGKTLAMIHVAIPDDENIEIFSEGIVFMINSIDNFCYITYQELTYLYYELCNINMSTLALMIMMTELLTGNQLKATHVEGVKTITESVPEEKMETYTKIQKPSEIPDI